MRKAKSDDDCADCLCRCCARSECNDSYNEQVDIDKDYCQGCNGCNGYVIENAEDCPRGQWLPDETDDGCSDVTNLTEEQKKVLNELYERGCTDSDVYDACVKYEMKERDADLYMSELNAPKQCKGCKHVTMFPSMPPCSSCSRACSKDMYERR